MIEVAKYSILALAVLVFVGGIIGFVKGKSKISVIAGTISSLLLGGTFYLAQGSAIEGIRDSLVIAVLLIIMFGIRLSKTKKFMPAGLMLIVCLLHLGVGIGALVSPH
jgi:uncharacterized membrane protein (UPF0136 family)